MFLKSWIGKWTGLRSGARRAENTWSPWSIQWRNEQVCAWELHGLRMVDFLKVFHSEIKQFAIGGSTGPGCCISCSVLLRNEPVCDWDLHVFRVFHFFKYSIKKWSSLRWGPPRVQNASFSQSIKLRNGPVCVRELHGLRMVDFLNAFYFEMN